MNQDEFMKHLSNIMNKEKLYLCDMQYQGIGEGAELNTLLFYEIVEKVEKYFKEVEE